VKIVAKDLICSAKLVHLLRLELVKLTTKLKFDDQIALRRGNINSVEIGS